MRCEIGRVPFTFLVHRPEDDVLPVRMVPDPITGEPSPTCTECARFLECAVEDYYNSFPTWDEIYGL